MFFDVYYCDVEIQIGEMCFVLFDSVVFFDGMIDWIIGVFYKSMEEKLLCQYIYLDSDFVSEYMFMMIVIYVQIESCLNENLVFVVGLRVENYDFDYVDNNQFICVFDIIMVGGKIVFQYI